MSVQINEILSLMGRMDNSFGKYMILAESQESKSISAAINLVMKEIGYDKQQADEFVRNDVRAQIPSLRNQITAKFILGATRLLLDGQLEDESIKDQFDTALKYASTEENINKFDRNLNGLSAQDIINTFAEQIKTETEKDKSEMASVEYQRNENYNIVRIDSFEQSEEYSRYTEWCVTRDYSMWNHYTNYGIGQFYFCLRNDFQNVEKKAGENNPLDDYGLSMIAVCVDENGRLKSCTSRWNLQDNDGMILTPKQLSELLGVNFYNVFKPNTVWKDTLAIAQEELNMGKDYWRVFDEVEEDEQGILYVRLANKWNVFLENSNTFLSKKWFDEIDTFSNGYVRIKLNNKYNMLNSKGELVFNQFFGRIFDEKCGCRRVQKKGKERWGSYDNFINQDCQFISDKWFDYAYDFSDGYAVVAFIKDSSHADYNFIDPNGNYLFDEWLEDADEFVKGVARISKNGKENFVKTNGELVLKDWADMASLFNEGISIVKINKKMNYVDTNGNYLSKQWYDIVCPFYDGYAQVVLNGKYNFLDKNFELLFPNQWYDDASGFTEGFAAVKLNRKWNFIRPDGTYLTPNAWYDSVDDDFDNGIAYVTINGISAVVNCYGEISATK